MKITIVFNKRIPVLYYGGTQRVIWYLGKELVKLGHEVTFLVEQGSICDFAKIQPIDNTKRLVDQISENTDVVHFHSMPEDTLAMKKPYVITVHGNNNDFRTFDKNTIFVSKNHAGRRGSQSYVYNGLDWDDYGHIDLQNKGNYYHFLGRAANRDKNVKGAIGIIKQTKSAKLRVLGGVRFNIKMGIRFTFSPRVEFYGSVGGDNKNMHLRHSKGLIFPVRWYEPFGLVITESLFFGSPVFATPYGSIPELVTSEVGFLSNSMHELAQAVENNVFNPQICHEYARDCFNSKKMALDYIEKYETVINGNVLNEALPKLKVLRTEKFLSWNP